MAVRRGADGGYLKNDDFNSAKPRLTEWTAFHHSCGGHRLPLHWREMTRPRLIPDSPAALGEEGLLRLLTGRWKVRNARVLTGVGDDCAVLRGAGRNHFLLLKTDAVVEGAHFTPETRPEFIGRKALARALSDLAAMGGRPVAAVVTLGVAADESARRLRAIYRGMERMAAKYGCDLVGGETTRAASCF